MYCELNEIKKKKKKKKEKLVVAIYRYISKKKQTSKNHWFGKKKCIKTSSFFNVLDYKFKNFVIGAFGSC